MLRARWILILGFLALLLPGPQPIARTADRLVTGLVDEHHRAILAGNTRSEARPLNDRGAIADNRMLEHMQILLNRPAAREAALRVFIAALSNPRSPAYHRWLTADQFGKRYGPDAADVSIVVAWLQQRGFRVNAVQPNRMIIDFSGTAGTVGRAFGTSIHHVSAGGRLHIANMSDPSIPQALSGIIHGVVSLHDFRPHKLQTPRAPSINPAYSFKNGNNTIEALVPADLATIYNLNPLFNSFISGQGQTIAVIENTDVTDTIDWITFRVAFGLAGYNTAWLVETHPNGGGHSCTDPGVVHGNESEALLDAEWASAAAPSAKIDLVSCSDTDTMFGGLIALQNLLNADDPPPIVSISYGECEAENGATANAAYNAAYQQAASMGISVFVATGDEGAASCDAAVTPATAATHGIGVSGFASTPYNVAVGGTDFGDTYAGTNALYWNRTNGSFDGSARSYVPEIAWNDSCASALLTQAAGFMTSYGSSGFCNSARGIKSYLSIASGSGGPSGCATGTPAATGIVGGSCRGYPKPAWQSVVGIPADGVRDVPDIALFAGNGAWGHYYVYCDSDTADGGVACSGPPSGWSGAGGTSFAAPIMAGIQALINQGQGGARQGNPNPVYYALARSEYGSGGNASCNATSGNAAGSGCVFYDVTQGDIDVNCTGPYDCYLPTGANGVLSTSSFGYGPAYGTGTGWDFATGIGSVNVTNLVDDWQAGLADAAASRASVAAR